MTALATTLQAFFTDRLIRQRQASPHTLAAYRDTLRLLLVYRRANHIVSRQVLMDEVWGYSAGVESHTAETHIYRLRQKIDDTNWRLLVTAPGGYRFDAHRAEISQPASPTVSEKSQRIEFSVFPNDLGSRKGNDFNKNCVL
jgi:DNA-binding winged helix-turn-helix (wHTH) protein